MITNPSQLKSKMSQSFSGGGLVPGLDYSSVEGLQRKRLLAFVNHFLTRTVESLTLFSQACDAKLASISTRLRKLENALLLLEAKLQSVPELKATESCPTSKASSSNLIVKVTATSVNYKSVNNLVFYYYC